MGYSTKSTMELIAHLHDLYTCIASMEMAENDEIIHAPYNAEEPLESLIERLNESPDSATAASEPVSQTQLVRIAYGLVAETGQYPEDLRA